MPDAVQFALMFEPSTLSAADWGMLLLAGAAVIVMLVPGEWLERRLKR